MTFDNSLNQDIITSHRYHCNVAYHLPDNDERKKSLRTPQLISRGIKRIMQQQSGVPSPFCIQQDCHLVIKNTGVVYSNNDKMVLSLDNINGHWVDNTGSDKCVGVRIKKYYHSSAPWLHPLATQALNEKSKKIMDNFTIDDDVACNLGITL